MTKILGIVGASYSGTTMMTMLLGALPGWFSAGETHWIKDVPSENFYCPTCKGACREWTNDFRDQLRNSTSWWSTMREGFSHHDWVVSSDKIPGFFVREPGVDHYLVQWKDPRSWYCSAKRHEGKSADEAAASWSGLYNRAFELIENGTPTIFVDWDYFCQNPVAEFNRIIGEFGVEPMPELPERNPDHMIGGNTEVVKKAKETTDGDVDAPSPERKTTIRQDTRWKTELSREEAQRVVEDPRVAEILGKLKESFETKNQIIEA